MTSRNQNLHQEVLPQKGLQILHPWIKIVAISRQTADQVELIHSNSCRYPTTELKKYCLAVKKSCVVVHDSCIIQTHKGDYASSNQINVVVLDRPLCRHDERQLLMKISNCPFQLLQTFNVHACLLPQPFEFASSIISMGCK